MKNQTYKHKHKLVTFFLTFNIFSSALFANGYKITSVVYNLIGRTREYPLRYNVPIDTNTVFGSQDEFNTYLNSLKQDFLNQRVLESAIIQTEFDIPTEKSNATKLINVHLVITTVDSLNFIAFPYPKYDSNNGFSAKIKAKDYNYLGSMNELEFELVYFTELPTYIDSNSQIIPMAFSSGNGIATNLCFTYPFKIGTFDSEWNNDITLAYVFGANTPYASSQTGFNFNLPFNKFSLDFDITEKYTYNAYYADTLGASYFTTEFTFSIPYILYHCDLSNDLILSPFTTARFITNTDFFTNPEIGGGVKLTNSNINWIKNFRKGFSQETYFSIFNALQSKDIQPEIHFESSIFNPFSNLAVNTRIVAFYNFLETDTKPLGNYMRGILDTEIYTTKAIIINLDIPISLFTTDWRKLSMPSITQYADFELQASPFIDVAICSSDTMYHVTSGIEIIVYPLKMRSIQVRGSIGFDLTDTQDIQKEIYVGLGLFY